MVSHFCIASHAFLRSARAPLPRFWILARDGRQCPLSHLPRAAAQARSSPRASACSQPPDGRVLYCIVGSSPPRMVALVAIPYRIREVRTRQLRRACFSGGLCRKDPQALGET
eukprot:499833-Pleurochrysis_carterae.AAC.3